jgi:enamine deaminase RidA (YjgF/YER057c/UK114 family)
MKIEHLAPEGLISSEGHGYSQVVRTDARTTIYIAGQGPGDKESGLVGKGDYYAQTQQALKNVMTAIVAAGGKPESIVSSVIYVVGLDDEAAAKGCIGALLTGQDGGPFPPNACSMIGVHQLMLPDMLIEISAVAVIEEGV